MRPIIALTCSTEQPTGAAPRRDFANHAYSAAVRRAGGTPVLIPSSRDEQPIRHAVAGAAGVLITGGKDISPAVYGEEVLPFCGPIDPARDDLDRWVIEAACELALPLLAICRGVQALAAFLGGSLYQDIDEQVAKAHSHRQDAPRNAPSHTIRAAPGTLLASIVGDDDLPVNSFHHQAVKDTPAALTVCAHAADGIIEGLEADGSRFLLGVQWHPEEMAADDRRQQALFDAFVEAARQTNRAD